MSENDSWKKWKQISLSSLYILFPFPNDREITIISLGGRLADWFEKMEKGGTEKVQYGAGELSVVTGNEAVVVMVVIANVVVIVGVVKV